MTRNDLVSYAPKPLPYALRVAEGVLCHVTPAVNLDSILERGISPLFSRNHSGRSYFCSVDRLSWALAHVSHNHAVPVNDLIIFTCGWQRKYIRFGLKGIFYRREMTIPLTWIVPGEFLECFERGNFLDDL